MVGWHHRLNGHEFEQALGDGKGQGSLACCSPWGSQSQNTPESLNNKKRNLTSRVTMEMQIKTTVRHQLLAVRKTFITTTQDNECWRSCRAEGILLFCWCKHRSPQSLRNRVEVSRKFLKEQPQEQRESFDVLRLRSGPAHPSLGNLVIPGLSEVAVFLPNLVQTPSHQMTGKSLRPKSYGLEKNLHSNLFRRCSLALPFAGNI